MGDGVSQLDYETTQPWRLALFFLGFALISIIAEKGFHWLLHHWQEQKKLGLVEMVNKFKEELMLLGFISLALVMCQDKLLGICVPECGGLWGKCYPADEGYNATEDGCGGGGAGASRRMLGAGAPVVCDDHYVPFITITALHQIHIFIFLLSVSLIVMGSAAMLICLAHLHTWAEWESEHRKFDASLGDANSFAPSAEDRSPAGPGRASSRIEMNEYEKLELLHGQRCYQFFCVPVLGVDKVTFLYLRRYFIRKHKRSKEFLFLRYIRECMQDDFAKTIEIDGNDWVVAMLTVAFRDYYFSLWASICTFLISVVVGVKLSAVSKMLVADVRDMVDRPTMFQTRRPSTEKLTKGHPNHQTAHVKKNMNGRKKDKFALNDDWVDEEMKLLEAAREAFQGVDDDDGGTLDKDEVRHLLEEMGAELDDDYYEQIFKRFDMDDSGELEYDEFLQCWRFMQSHKEEFGLNDDATADEDIEAVDQGGFERTRKRALSKGKTALGTLTRMNTKRPNLKKGRVTWCCGSIGPSMNPEDLHRLVQVTMFQNAIVVAQILFTIWQLGSDSHFFQEPAFMPGGIFLLQALIVILQQVHTSFVLLPMFALVRQMGKHYNSRLFGDAAGKAILGWAARTRKKTIAAKKRQSHTRRIMTGLRGEVNAAHTFNESKSSKLPGAGGLGAAYLSNAGDEKNGKGGGMGMGMDSGETPLRTERTASPALEETDIGDMSVDQLMATSGAASPLPPVKPFGSVSPRLSVSVGFASAGGVLTTLELSQAGGDGDGRAGVKLTE